MGKSCAAADVVVVVVVVAGVFAESNSDKSRPCAKHDSKAPFLMLLVFTRLFEVDEEVARCCKLDMWTVVMVMKDVDQGTVMQEHTITRDTARTQQK